jgi:hypothetical protein
MSTDKKEGFMDETTGREELLGKVKDQTAESKKNEVTNHFFLIL